MTRAHCVRSTVFVFFLIFISSAASAAWIGDNSKSPVRSHIVKASMESTVIDLEFSGYDLSESKTLGEDYASLHIPGLTKLDGKGFPAMPKWSGHIAIPQDSFVRARFEILEERVDTIRDIEPSKGTIERNLKPSEVPHVFSSFYSAGQSFPDTNFNIFEQFQLRDIFGVRLQVVPFQFDRSNNQLRFLKRVRIHIEHKAIHGKARFFALAEGATDSEFRKIYEDQFLNFTALQARTKVNHWIRDNGRILVIAHEDFVQGMQPLHDWRRDTGHWIKVVSLAEIRDETGQVDYNLIKNYIQSEFDANQISYVLLVGDREFVPTHPGMHGNAWGEEADPMYALVAGNDSYPDLVVSRFSVKNNFELDTIIQKTLRYEQSPEIGGDWYSKATGVASMEGVPTDYERANLLRDMLVAWHYQSFDEIYEPNDHNHLLVDALNEGRGFINYLGHGTEDRWVSTNFTNDDILNLRNGDRVPVIVSVACVNGDFGYPQDTFAEIWLKAGSPNESKGALTIFASSTNQSWVPPTVGQKEITHLLTTERMSRVGALMFHGSIAVLEDGSSSAEQTFETWHIFGDGTTEIRTQAPQAIVFEENPLIQAEQQNIHFKVDGDNIRVGVVLNDRLVSFAQANSAGELNVTLLEKLKPGDRLRLTFTGMNRIPVVNEHIIR